MPFGRYSRTSPLAFSFDPRCHGLCGSQKKMSKSARDLLGGPTAAQPIDHCAPKRRLEIGAELAASSACSGTPTLALRLRGRCAIAVGKSLRRGLAANDLAADGGRTAAELVCDLTPTTSGLKQQLDRNAIGLAQMRVVSSHLRDTLQDARCRTSTLSRPSNCTWCA